MNETTHSVNVSTMLDARQVKKKKIKRLVVIVAIALAMFVFITVLFFCPGPDPGSGDVGLWIQRPTSYFSWVTTQDRLIMSGSASPHNRITNVLARINGTRIITASGTGDWNIDITELESGDNVVVCEAYIGRKKVAADTVWVTRNQDIEFTSKPEFSQDLFFIGSQNPVTVLQSISTCSIEPERVILCKLNSDFQVVSELASLTSNDTQPSSSAVTNATYKATMDLSSPSPGKEFYRIAAYAREKGHVDYSPIIEVEFYRPITAKSWAQVIETQNKVSGLFRQKEVKDTKAAISYAHRWLSERSDIRAVKKNNNTLHITYNSGLRGSVVISDVNENGEIITKGKDNSSKGNTILGSILLFLSGCTGQTKEDKAHRTKQRNQRNGNPIPESHSGITDTNRHDSINIPLAEQNNDPIYIGNNRVLIWSPFEYSFPIDVGPQLIDIFQQSPIEFEINAVTDFDCTVNSLRNLTEYGTVIIDTHGREGKSFMSGELVTEENMQTYALLNLSGQIGMASNLHVHPNGRVEDLGTFYSINAGFISALDGDFSNSLVFNSSCSSSKTSDLYDAFAGKGVKAYLGFSNTVSVSFAASKTKEFFNTMAISCTSTGEAYQKDLDGYNPGTIYTMSGSPNLRYMSQNEEANTVTNDTNSSATSDISVIESNQLVYVAGGRLNNGKTDFLVSPFYIGKYEITQYEFNSVMGYNPSGNNQGANYPVEMIDWFAAIEYCNRLSLKQGLKPSYSYGRYGTNPKNWPTGWNKSLLNQNSVFCDWSAAGYRLPTEMEWIFAAQGGNSSRGYKYSGSNDIGLVAWYLDNASNTTHFVGGKLPNELGIYDMSGNVEEWVWDFAGPFPDKVTLDYRGAKRGEIRSSCGGSISHAESDCHTRSRSGFSLGGASANHYSQDLGFRICRQGRNK